MSNAESSFSILDSVLSKWNALHDRSKIPNALCHYTTFDGLQGILGSSALRATFSQCLNDGSEWKFGKSVVDKYAIPKGTEEALEVPPSTRLPPPKSMFVTCFCEEPNLLSMWRSYTSQGGGYCLVFDGAPLDRLQRDRLGVGEFAARLVKVHYGETPSTEMKDLLDSGGHLFASWLIENMFKHEGFQEEKEWRIIVPDPPASLMSFHSGHATIKASVQVRNQNGDNKLPLRKVIYGPTLRDDAALVETLRWMLEKYGYGHVAVENSPIPYRL
jgi:hypothetical protein